MVPHTDELGSIPHHRAQITDHAHHAVLEKVTKQAGRARIAQWNRNGNGNEDGECRARKLFAALDDLLKYCRKYKALEMFDPRNMNGKGNLHAQHCVTKGKCDAAWCRWWAAKDLTNAWPNRCNSSSFFCFFMVCWKESLTFVLGWKWKLRRRFR